MPGDGDGYMATDGRLFAAISLNQDVGCLLAGGDDGIAMRQPFQQGGDVRGGHDLEELVGGIVCQPADFRGGIIHGKAFFRAESHDPSFVKTLLSGNLEMALVLEKEQAADPPEIVDPVRVVEVHAPASGLGREAAEEEYPGFLRQERLERMLFCVHGSARAVSLLQI